MSLYLVSSCSIRGSISFTLRKDSSIVIRVAVPWPLIFSVAIVNVSIRVRVYSVGEGQFLSLAGGGATFTRPFPVGELLIASV
jgi:hypothetical protein